MTDLPEQLRAYVDAVAEPVTLNEIRGRAERTVVEPVEHGARRGRRRQLGLVAAAVTLAIVAALAVIRSSGNGASPPIAPVVAPRLIDVAPTWSSTPITFDGASPSGLTTTLAATDERVVVTSGSVYASAPELGAMTTSAQATSVVSVSFAYPGGFVTAGMTTPDTAAPTAEGQHATVTSSPDGVTWTDAPAGPFTPRERGGSPASIVRGFAWNKGMLVAIGDFYTGTPKARQCCGLSPAVWTSQNGGPWKRRVLDLGNEFDPYMESIVWFRGEWVATGRSGRGSPLVVWRSKDLVHWDKSVVQRHAGGQVSVANDALYVSGGIAGGTKEAPTVAPAVWRSTDGLHWERVLALPPEPIDAPRGVRPVMASGAVLVTVASGAGSTRPTTVVYESVDGRDWTPTPTPAIPSGTSITASGMVRNQPTFVGTLDGKVTAWSAVPHTATGKWAAQCAVLETIRQRNEAEPSRPDPTKGQAGLDQLERDYQRLVAEAADERTRHLWRTVAPVLAHGVTTKSPTIAQRDAVAELDALLATHCNESTGNVFKIVVQ